MAKRFISKASSSSLREDALHQRNQRQYMTQHRLAQQQQQQQQQLRWQQQQAFPHSSSDSSINRMCQGMAAVSLTPNGASTAVSDFWETPAVSGTPTFINNGHGGGHGGGSVTMFRTKVIYHSGDTPASSGDLAAQYQQQLQQNRIRLIHHPQPQQQPQPPSRTEEAAV